MVVILEAKAASAPRLLAIFSLESDTWILLTFVLRAIAFKFDALVLVSARVYRPKSIFARIDE